MSRNVEGLRRFSFAILYSLSSILVFSSASCSTAALVMYKLSPPQKVPAKYVPKKEPMLVLVENYENPSVTHISAQQLATALRADLERNNVAPLVDPDRLVELRDANPDGYRKLSIPQIGQSVGARQVLYINLQTLTVEGDGVMARGIAQGQLKIVDATTGQTRWPTDLAAGHEVLVQTPFTRLDEHTTESTLQASLIAGVSDQVSKLFYKWTVPEGVQ
jgi:hypothetical protein